MSAETQQNDSLWPRIKSGNQASRKSKKQKYITCMFCRIIRNDRQEVVKPPTQQGQHHIHVAAKDTEHNELCGYCAQHRQGWGGGHREGSPHARSLVSPSLIHFYFQDTVP